MAETPNEKGEAQFPEFPEPPDTSDIEARLKQVRSTQTERPEASKVDVEKRRSNEKADARGLGTGLQIAYAIIGFPILGFGVGTILDHFLATGYWKGFIGLAGCILAVVSALILIKQANAQS